jgi:hypothetical protein
MMALKLPKDPVKDEKPARSVPMVQSDALSPEDTIEYGITMEVSPGPGKKAWIKLGTTSSVRDGETTEQARHRVTQWVEEELDHRINELGE